MDGRPAVLAVVLQTGDVGAEERCKLAAAASSLALIAQLVIQHIWLHFHLQSEEGNSNIISFTISISAFNLISWVSVSLFTVLMLYQSCTKFLPIIHIKRFNSRIIGGLLLRSSQWKFKNTSTEQGNFWVFLLPG